MHIAWLWALGTPQSYDTVDWEAMEAAGTHGAVSSENPSQNRTKWIVQKGSELPVARGNLV